MVVPLRSGSVRNTAARRLFPAAARPRALPPLHLRQSYGTVLAGIQFWRRVRRYVGGYRRQDYRALGSRQ